MIYIYIVFPDPITCAEHNGLWLMERYNAGEFDCKQGIKVAEQITSACDYGRPTKYGTIACQVPAKFKAEFTKYAGIEMELTEDDFLAVETEV